VHDLESQFGVGLVILASSLLFLGTVSSSVGLTGSLYTEKKISENKAVRNK
jgi:hypothetical protein